MGLLAALQKQRRVFVGETPQTGAQLVLGGPGLGNQPVGQHRLGPGLHLDDGPPCVGEGVAGAGLLELGDPTDVSRGDGVDVLLRASHQADQTPQPLAVARSGVGEVVVPVNGARKHSEQGYLAHVVVADGLEHAGELVTVGIAGWLGVDVAHGDGHGPRGGRGADLHQEVGQPIHRNRPGSRAAHHGEYRSIGHAPPEHHLKLGRAGDIAVEVLLQHVVVGHHDAFHELLVDLGFLILHLLGNLGLFGSTAVVDVGLVGEQVGDAVEAWTRADRQLQWGDSGTEGVLQFGEDALEAGVFPVELVHEHDAGQAGVGSLAPDGGGPVVHPAGGVDHEHQKIGHLEGGVQLAGVVGSARRVDQVDLVAVPVEAGQSQRLAVGGGLLLGAEVANRGAFLHPARAVDDPGPVQQRLSQRGLSRSLRPHQRDVADLLRCDSHQFPPMDYGFLPR